MQKPALCSLLFAGWLLFVLFFVVSFSSNVLAEPSLTLEETIRLATQDQPILQSLDAAASASREEAVAEGQLPDPKLKFGVQNLPITGSNALNFNRDDQTMTTIGIMQEVVPKSKREVATRRIEAEAEQFHTEQMATARSIQRDVALAWLDVFEAQRKSELYQRLAVEMAAERQVALARISSGGAQAGEVLRLDSQLSMMNDKRLTARRDEQRARAVLSRWIGSAAARPLPAELNSIKTEAPHDDAAAEIENHPMLQNARQAEAVAISDVDQAKAEHDLNWSWEVMYGKRRSDLSDMITFQVAVDLPWDRPNRQDKRTAEKMVLVEKAQKLTEDRRRELNAELESTLADSEAAKAREEEHQQHLIPTAQSRLKVAQAGYEAGKQNLSEVWEARRNVIEVEMEHWAILTDIQRAAVKLGYLLNDNSIYAGSQL